jgi:hypothetical protein
LGCTRLEKKLDDLLLRAERQERRLLEEEADRRQREWEAGARL